MLLWSLLSEALLLLLLHAPPKEKGSGHLIAYPYKSKKAGYTSKVKSVTLYFQLQHLQFPNFDRKLLFTKIIAFCRVQQLQKVVTVLPNSPSLDKLAKSRSSGDLRRLLSPEAASDGTDPIKKSSSSGKIMENDGYIPEVRNLCSISRKKISLAVELSRFLIWRNDRVE